MQHNIRFTPINKFSIKNILNSKIKDIIPPEEKSGFYQISCNDCDKIYIGKTKRNIQIRAKEHFRNIKFFQTDKSAVAADFWQTYHEIDLKPILLKPLNNKNELDIWEYIFILKNKDRAMNFKIPPADVLIKKFIFQTPEGRTDSRGTGLKMGGNPSETCSQL